MVCYEELNGKVLIWDIHYHYSVQISLDWSVYC